MKKTILTAALLSVFAAGALAQELGATGNVALTSNYKFRGQDQTSNKPAIQGGFDLSHGGFYLGNWNSSIDWIRGSGLEADLYGGYRGEISGLGYDVGVLRYQYPGASTANTTELYAGVSHGPLAFKYSHTASKEYFTAPEGRGTGYLDLAANYELMPRLTLNAHLGYTSFSSDAERLGAVSYADYKLGATYDLGKGFALAGAAAGANKKDVEAYSAINKTRFIVTLSKAL